VNSAAGHLNGTLFREYLGDVSIRPTPASKLFYEFPIRLKARAGRLVRQFVQKFLQLGVHGDGVERGLSEL
jgi:hypothetical protein